MTGVGGAASVFIFCRFAAEATRLLGAATDDVLEIFASAALRFLVVGGILADQGGRCHRICSSRNDEQGRDYLQADTIMVMAGIDSQKGLVTIDRCIASVLVGVGEETNTHGAVHALRWDG